MRESVPNQNKAENENERPVLIRQKLESLLGPASRGEDQVTGERRVDTENLTTHGSNFTELLMAVLDTPITDPRLTKLYNDATEVIPGLKDKDSSYPKIPKVHLDHIIDLMVASGIPLRG